jgi:dipeptidyl aminopeptidase/acylaminoacyl peptidase
VNITNEVVHTRNRNVVEVVDEASDVVVYDVNAHEIVTSDVLSSEESFETFPTFSPDGRSLFFCSAEAVEPMPAKFREAKYSLCRVDFNPEDCLFGTKVDTLYNARMEGRSVSFPRISPDGRFLVFALSEYGNFSIWHKDADLYSVDLKTGEISSMEALNSDDVESYHSWSGNSRWLVFSSRRDDGLYTKPYFSYIDEEGKAHKPFLLPQKNPRKYYDSQMYAYNIPEFVSGRVKLTGSEIADFARTGESRKLKYRKR